MVAPPPLSTSDPESAAVRREGEKPSGEASASASPMSVQVPSQLADLPSWAKATTPLLPLEVPVRPPVVLPEGSPTRLLQLSSARC